MENILKQLVQINERLARLEDSQPASAVATADVDTTLYSTAAEAAPPAPATASTLAGCAHNWYTNKIWETVKGKKEQNKRADAKAAVNIMLVLYQAPCTITEPPPRSNGDAYQAWKHDLWELSLALDRTANERLRGYDDKKPTTKAPSLRKRWRALRVSHPAAYKALGAQYLALKANGSISDSYTPVSHQWMANDVA
ncbi:hypothetical protein PR003_g14736 [Phytophthora rubi]|uniref:Uncharacterized protein n=1 Tax=Phytophthora rubi TaxID=129364 RepID=A0A6A3LQA4_9STRA|nr:hypothetical protein PR002_g12235 [Phytophthora rubi]KAE9027807.1 hypothetical protein PR001_g11884 [Phytophthora rubi]KAE9332001.1 hypothetical protein PR003_g14736 [Phytophthora rubi]